MNDTPMWLFVTKIWFCCILALAIVRDFDPRSLAGGDFWFNAGVFALFAALLLDWAFTRYGCWYYGFREANPLMRWFVAPSVFRAVLDAAIRFGVVAAFLAATTYYGFVDRAHAWLPWALAGLAAIAPARNLAKLVVAWRRP